MSENFSYDDVPYPSFTFPQTRPDRLSSVGRFYGIETAMPDKCRVLELGCGDGTNLLSFAYCHPESEFLGIDLSKVHIDDARKAGDQLGLENAVFECADVTAKPSAELGKFDFIIAHGLFSWVPDFVREHILRIYSECLNPNGVGYISYNAFPGFHVRQIVRGLAKYHTAGIDDADEKVNQTKNILGFVRQALPDDSLNAQIIERELKEMFERSSSNIFHDDLSESNQAFYFHEFAEIIKGHGLQYIAEADISSSNISGMSEDVVNALNAIGTDIIRREQYIDFIKFRRFRSTLICHSSVELARSPEPSVVRNFRFSSPLKPPANANLFDTEPVTFTGERDETAQLNHPLTKTMLAELGRSWTHSIDFDELLAKAASDLAANGVPVSDEDVAKAEAYLLQMIRVELVRIHRFAPQIATGVSERPKTSDFARWQIEHGCKAVTTMTGMNLEPESDLVRIVISLADGTRDIDQIQKELLDAVDVPDEQRADLEANVPRIVEDCLNDLCSAGLLVG
jgi:methyltransferase-like protein/SAM-dependent methyltransferase